MARRIARNMKPAQPLLPERLSRRTALIVIVGPTAAGKSELAVRLAKKFDGEVISADSRQVYRSLDIGTGKVPGAWRRIRGRKLFVWRGVPHHCIDVVPPERQYTVAEFKRSAEGAIRGVASRGRVPILVGGSGFWIDVAAYGLALPAVRPNPALRRRLAKKSADELLALLKRYDPERARAIEIRNPRRLIRAIEIALALGRVPKLRRKRSPWRLLWLGKMLPEKILKRRIRTRLALRIRRGMVAEARRLHERGLSWRRFYELGLEYRYLADYLRKTMTKREMTVGLEKATWRYARRQLAWFGRNPDIRWVAGGRDAERIVRAFLYPGISARRRG